MLTGFKWIGDKKKYELYRQRRMFHFKEIETYSSLEEQRVRAVYQQKVAATMMPIPHT
jgi:hypothetical protein